MSEMIERVADALQEAAKGTGGRLSRDTAVLLARVALEAMREPTDEMLDSVVSDTPAYVAESLWRAMINAALGGSE